MYWRISHYSAGDAPSCGYAVKTRSREAARRKLTAAIQVPLWTLR